ncbi:MAG: hypothetical protein BMS9Abin37_3118 [Acidobacteriota bacterium]|nr:MAG: hypothetical protein BMS9Abin37_3118 [Acidobacteriota bacterium]
MSAEKPDYHDGDLVLRLYEMRREAKTREARDLLNFQFWPKTYDDVKEVQKFDNPMNFAWRQLSTYWETVFGMARNGIVNADYLTENNGEGLFFFAKIAPYVDQIREDGSPMAFKNVEWATKESETGRQMYAYISKMVQERIESD